MSFDPELYSVVVPVTDIIEDPKNTTIIGKNDSQLLYGETVKLDDENDDYCHVTSQIDAYTGYVKTDHLALQKAEPTHIVDTLWAHIYPEPHFKARPILALPFLARIKIEKEEENGFKRTSQGWVYSDALKPIEDTAIPIGFVKTAERFLGCPYVYAGRTAQGLDCSALVQLSLLRCGVKCARDSNQQIDMGEDISRDNVQRGDLVFFKGHVGIMLDDTNILNATSRTMDTRVEKLEDLASIYDGIIGIKRLLGYSP